MAFVARSANDILQSLAARVITRSDLTDLTEGSVLLHILASVADEITTNELGIQRVRDSYHFDNISGRLLDERCGELPPKGLTRLGAASASGAVMRVEREDTSGTGAYPGTVVLAAGASFRRSDDGSQTYRTITDYTFGPGVGFLTDIWVVANSPGKNGNCAINTITVIDEADPVFIACSNQSPLANGVNEEGDAMLKQRVLAYMSSLARCQPRALEFACLSYQTPEGNRVKWVNVYEDVERPGYTEIIVDDGSALNGTLRDGATTSGTVPDGGAFLLWHEKPATEPIEQIVVTSADGTTTTTYTYSAGHYTSIPERGIVYFPPGILNAGETWEIGPNALGDQYQVYTGIVAGLQTLVEGSTSSPGLRPGLRAAGTRVRVKPPQVQEVAFDVHIAPISGISLTSLRDRVLSDIVAFTQTLAPGKTLFVSHLIDYLMNNQQLLNVRFYNTATADPLDDVEALSYYHAIRANAADINVIPAPED